MPDILGYRAKMGVVVPSTNTTMEPELYALRLHEAGMIKSSPQKIITQGTDWRFLTALKKELKE
jgi:maleate cis-trans isomerase